MPSSSLIPLFGIVANPNCPGEDEAFYILRETQISPTLWRYDGRIGYGWSEEDADKVPPSIVFDTMTGTSSEKRRDPVFEPGFPCGYFPFDMRDFAFTFNTETNQIVVECEWRLQTYAPEAQSLVKNVHVEDPDIRLELDDETYPYFRYPRTKDGIAVSRVFDTIFKNIDGVIGNPIGTPITVMLPLRKED